MGHKHIEETKRKIALTHNGKPKPRKNKKPKIVEFWDGKEVK